MDGERPNDYRLGADVEVYCRYCRLNLDGVISALDSEGNIAKVKCGTCGHFQDFKPPVDMEEKHRKLVAKAMRIAERHTRGPDAARGSSVRSGKASHGLGSNSSEVALTQEAVMRRLWEEATADVSPMKARVYDKFRSYHKDDVISHKAHGLGVVVRDDVEGSMTVLFRDSVLELEHNAPRED